MGKPDPGQRIKKSCFPGLFNLFRKHLYCNQKNNI
jgi:hypothetical protein